MTAFYNLSSLALGLLAWILGLYLIFCKKRRLFVMSTSFSCMGASLVLQFLELRHRILIGDLSAVMDIYPSMAWIALVLFLVTVGLNLIALFTHRK